MKFNKKAILDLKNKIQSRELQPNTEEATKQWLIMPMLVALGYDPYSSDIIPEYTVDVGTRRGEKVDYAIQINNQPVALVECKQLNVQLSDKYISQLYRYFTVSDVHIAILTNGDDYWFFTDSKKENVMDLEPYYKIKLSDATEDEMEKMAQYSKELIQYADISQVVQHERFQTECKELVHALRTNNIPSWLLEVLAERSGMIEIDKPTLAEYMYSEIQSEFNGFKVDKKDKKVGKEQEHLSIGAKMKATMEENKKNISNIKLNHEYVYNDYSDGDWKFHSIGYAIILGNRFENISARGLLIHTVEELFKSGKFDRERLLEDKRFHGAFRISANGDFRGATYIEGLNVYVGTAHSIVGIITFIEKLLEFCGVQNSQIILSFKS